MLWRPIIAILITLLTSWAGHLVLSTSPLAKWFAASSWVWFVLSGICSFYLLFAPFTLLMRGRFARAGLAVLWIIGFMVVGRLDNEQMRIFAQSQLDRFAREAHPLVEAVEKYSAKYGAPPAQLELLIPEFLTTLPGVPVAQETKWNYRADFGLDGAPVWQIWADVSIAPWLRTVTYADQPPFKDRCHTTSGKWHLCRSGDWL
jgi:hypothetical protein